MFPVRVVDGHELPRRDVERLLVEREALGGALRVGGVDILDLEPDAGPAAPRPRRGRREDHVPRPLLEAEVRANWVADTPSREVLRVQTPRLLGAFVVFGLRFLARRRLRAQQAAHRVPELQWEFERVRTTLAVRLGITHVLTHLRSNKALVALVISYLIDYGCGCDRTPFARPPLMRVQRVAEPPSARRR